MTKHNLGKVSLNLKLFDSEFRLFDGKEETNPSKAKQKEAQYGFHQLILSTSARKKSDCSKTIFQQKTYILCLLLTSASSLSSSPSRRSDARPLLQSSHQYHPWLFVPADFLLGLQKVWRRCNKDHWKKLENSLYQTATLTSWDYRYYQTQHTWSESRPEQE